MIEDILEDLRKGEFVVSNTFQVVEPQSPFGLIGWQVYIRNTWSTRAGRGDGMTMEEAMRNALAKAMEGEAYSRPRGWERYYGAAAGATLAGQSPPRTIVLGAGEQAAGQDEDLF